MKKILSIIIFILFATVTIVADTIDVSALLVQNADNIDMVDNMGDNSQLKNFGISVLSSLVAAIIALFLFFKLFRTRLVILPTIGLVKNKNNQVELQFLLKNKGLFDAMDIKIKIEEVGEFQNEDIKSTEICTTPIHYFSLKGILHPSNDNELCIKVPFSSMDNIPNKIAIILISQHSLSGVVRVKRFEFQLGNYEEGQYEKGLFIPFRLSYKQKLFRNNISLIEKCIVASFSIVLIEGLILFTLQFFSLEVNIIIILMSILLAILSIVLWILLIHLKGNAYNKCVNRHVQIIMAAIGLNNSKKKESTTQEVVEAECEEIESISKDSLNQ